MGTVRLRYFNDEGRILNGIDALHFADGGKLLVSFGGGEARAWDVATGREVRRLRSGPQSIGAVSADGRLIASAARSGEAVYITDAATGKEVQTIQGLEEYWMEALALSPDGRLLTITRKDALALHRLPSGEEVRPPRLSGAVTFGFHPAVVFSLDGKVVAAGGRVAPSISVTWRAVRNVTT
jgi:WD40 repeat protein